jgi:multidrug efflux pump subunit AcrB
MEPHGFSGRVARLFTDSKLTPLLIVASLALGVYAVVVTPKEEEPTIVVPAADVLIAYPGAGSQEVDQRIARPVASWIREIPDVEHVITAASHDAALVTVQFREGVNREAALTRLYDKLAAHIDEAPPGVQPPLVKPRGIEDVPVLTLTLWSDRDDGASLRRVATELASRLEDIPDVSGAKVIGGYGRELAVQLDRRRLAERGVSPVQVVHAIQAANVRLPAGSVTAPTGVIRVEAGALLRTPEDVASLIVGTTPAGPVYLRDVAAVHDRPEDPSSYVLHHSPSTGGGHRTAATIAITKLRGTNAAVVNDAVLARLETLRDTMLPSDVQIEVTRNAGESASHRVLTLLEHMLLATVIVIGLIVFALGWREGAIVAIVIPVTLALVPFIYYLTGFTLNRITLAAMIFAIGILVDDAIVVIENIHRHFQMGGAPPLDAALIAVDEVGNPTILATFTVIAALLPTAFVTGMTGQYLRPLPIGASVAMLYSLVVALTVTPYLSYRMLRHESKRDGAHAERMSATVSRGRLTGWYRAAMIRFLDRQRWRFGLYAATLLLLAGSVALVAFGSARVKLLPYGDVDEFAVMIDLPEGASLQTTASAAASVGEHLRSLREVKGYQIYAGTAGPVTFQGIARHYMLRHQPQQAEIQVQLVPASQRTRESHDIAQAIRPAVQQALAPFGATLTIAEAPPGPPVQATIVAEVYGPAYEGQIALARDVRRAFARTSGIADVDWSVEEGPPRLRLSVNHHKAAVNGLAAAQVAHAVHTLVAGERAGLARLPDDREPVPIMVRLPRHERSAVPDLESLYLTGPGGRQVPLSDVVDFERDITEPTIVRKDLLPVVFVTGEAVGSRMAPLYAVLNLTPAIHELVAPDGRPPQVHWAGAPGDASRYSIAWAGEWTTTYEVFRDLGLAFLGVLVLIYLMLVGWFGSFLVPLVIMVPIPLTLIGVFPAHAVLGMFISGTGVIGVIALAGILVRNSILLVDFVNVHLAEGMPLREAVLKAGTVRARPILLTASAVILGDGILLFDPLLEGLGLTLMSGALVSTALTLLLVPVLLYHARSRTTLTGRAHWRAKP